MTTKNLTNQKEADPHKTVYNYLILKYSHSKKNINSITKK